MMWSSVGSLTRLGCNYLVSSVLVVRLAAGFDAAGMLALAMAIANLVNPIADFRLRTVQVTDVTGSAAPANTWVYDPSCRSSPSRWVSSTRW